MIIFFAIERNEEMTSKKCCENKYCHILYKLAISVGIKLEQEAEVNSVNGTKSLVSRGSNFLSLPDGTAYIL